MEFETYLTLGVMPDDDRRNLRISEDLLKTHLAIFGGTRFGKSKLMELICRELLLNRRAFAFIDPHSDTADDILAFVCKHAEEFPFIKKKVHYLKPGDSLFSFDPFRYYPDPDDPRQHTETAYRNWLHTKVKDMARIICRQQGDSEDEAQKMVRLRRWLYNALYAVGVRQDARGTHLAMKDAFILLNPQHPCHDDRYRRVEGALSDEVRADFQKLRRTKDARKQEDWVESTLNRLRDILSPTLQNIFSVDQPSIDFVEIIRRGEILLASLGKTKFFHEDEAMAVAGLLIREISEAVRTINRDKRQQFYLFIDEAHNFLGDDLIRLLKESAKYKLSFGLAVQGLDNLQKGEIDMVPAVLGQCGIRITFRQQFHEHAEALAKSLGYPMLDFTELLHEVDRDAGYDWFWTPSVGKGNGTTESLQYGITESHSETEGFSTGSASTTGFSESAEESSTWGRTRGNGFSSSHTRGISNETSVSSGEADMRGANNGESSQVTDSRSEGISESARGALTSIQHGKGHSTVQGMQAAQQESTTVSRQDGQSEGTSESFGDTISRNSGSSEGGGLSHGRSESSSESRNQSRNESTSTGIAHSRGAGLSRSQNTSMTFQLTPLHQTRVEIQRTGQLQISINDQFARRAAAISSLGIQECLVAVASFNSAFLLRVADVRNPFEGTLLSPKWQQLTVARLKREIFARLPYYFEPPDEPLRISHLQPKALDDSTLPAAGTQSDDPII